MSKVAEIIEEQLEDNNIVQFNMDEMPAFDEGGFKKTIGIAAVSFVGGVVVDRFVVPFVKKGVTKVKGLFQKEPRPELHVIDESDVEYVDETSEETVDE